MQNVYFAQEVESFEREERCHAEMGITEEKVYL